MGPAVKPFGFNIVGHISGDFGLGIAARNTVAQLLELGHDVCVVDVRGGGGEKGQNHMYDHLHLMPGRKLPYAITLYHMNPIEIRVLLNHKPSWFAAGRTLNIVVPFWELPRIPRPWEPIVHGMDAVLAPTHFIASAVRAALPEMQIINYPQSVSLPQGIVPDRKRWGIPEECFTVFTTFHTGSGLARKNPLAAVQAFRAAFGDSQEACLVIKLTRARPSNPIAAHEHDRQVNAMLAEVVDAPNIVVIERSLPYLDVLSLYSSCDALLSLHRSEGLGLHLMEAMALSRVVVATGWSGNMDFMTAENSLPVEFRLVPVSETPPIESAYSAEFVGEDLTWAEPDILQATTILRRLAEDPALRKGLGSRAEGDMRAKAAATRAGKPFEEIEVMLSQIDLDADRPSAELLATHWKRSPSMLVKDLIKRLIGRR